MSVDFDKCSYCEAIFCKCSRYYQCNDCLTLFCSLECSDMVFCENSGVYYNCRYCTGKNANDIQMLKFALKKLNMSYEELFAQYRKELNHE